MIYVIKLRKNEFNNKKYDILVDFNYYFKNNNFNFY